MESAAALVSTGELQQAEDIFYLSFKELEDLPRARVVIGIP